MAYDKKSLRDFADRWRGRGYEKGDTQQFWLQLLRDMKYPHVDDVLFEHHLPSGGFIDVWVKDAGVLIEQKAFGVDLNKPEPRQGTLKTPLIQALDYVDELPRPEQPRFVVTCNFGTFRVYDRDKWGRSQLNDHAFEFTLDELAEHPEYLAFIGDPNNSRFEKEKQASIQAGELIGKLYDKMRAGYINPDAPENMHALNVLCVRLVFCLYCEDADLFAKDSFHDYLKDVPANDIRMSLKRLFRALDTDVADRDPYDMTVKIFPYVNGGLFRDDTEVPNFTEEMKQFLLEYVSAPVDWSKISPTIFGGIFESTLNPETRRSGGMHYTSPENIHKVIDPLFLDDLKAEFAAIKDEEGATPRKKKAALERFHKKLCNLKFFDPACGSGNFLTETYICLRKLEDAVLNELMDGQTGFGFADDEMEGNRVSLAQFYGIEINDFAVTVAEVALWISRLKANAENSMFYDTDADDFPLHEKANIVHGNALRIDWNEVLPASECSYIIGNPPFLGAHIQSREQKVDLQAVFHGSKNSGNIDYVAGWYWKAAAYMGEWPVRTAFVSTNSICQGQQVEPIWKPLFDKGFHIDFAWPTFVWENEASSQAHVHVIIVGFSKQSGVKKALHKDGMRTHPSNINAYLTPSPNVFIEKRLTPMGDIATMTNGSKPCEGGNLLMSHDEMKSFVEQEPLVRQYIRRFIGSVEYINDKLRYCLWLVDATEEQVKAMPTVWKRAQAVREMRLKSPDQTTVKSAKTPWLFQTNRQPSVDYLIVPRVSSSRREYIPIGFCDKNTIAGDGAQFVPGATVYHFGILTSQFHNAWMRVVAGRLKGDYRYSGVVVYNNFIWPEPTAEQRQRIETCAQGVLDARDAHPGVSLAKLYDPDLMPADLLASHKALDKAVEEAYGVNFDGDEEKIVTHLFKLYAEKTAD